MESKTVPVEAELGMNKGRTGYGFSPKIVKLIVLCAGSLFDLLLLICSLLIWLVAGQNRGLKVVHVHEENQISAVDTAWSVESWW